MERYRVQGNVIVEAGEKKIVMLTNPEEEAPLVRCCVDHVFWTRQCKDRYEECFLPMKTEGCEFTEVN